MSEVTDEVAEKIASFHELHAKRVMRLAGISADEYMRDPETMRKNGYRLIHEVSDDGEHHSMVVAKVLAQDDYKVEIGVKL